MAKVAVDHPRWSEFADRLGGPEGCDFTEETWVCHGGTDKRFAIAILARMGFDKDDIEETIEYFDSNGGHCDCEILFNVDARLTEDESGV